MVKETSDKEINLTIKVLLRDSHPYFAEHSGFICKKIGELLHQRIGEEKQGGEMLKMLGLPEGVPFKLNVMASHEGHGKPKQGG